MARPVIVNVVEAQTLATTTVSIPNVQVGDWIVATQAIDFVTASILVTPTGTGSGTWSQIGTIAGDVASVNMKMRSWRKIATGTGTYTAIFVQTGNPDPSANLVIAYHLRGVIDFDGAAGGTIGQGTSGTAQSLPALSPSTSDSLLVGFWAGIQFGGTQTYAKPTGTSPLWTEDSEIGAANGTSAMMAASAPLTSSGSTGAKVATASPDSSSGWAGKMMAFEGQQVVLNTSSDSGAGTDTNAVARSSTSTDSGVGTDTDTVLRDSTSTDSGAGTETNAVTQLYSSADSGAGTDTLFVTAIEHISSSDSGVGTDSLDALIPVLKESSDSGVGTEGPTSILPVSDLTDSGAGTDTNVVARTSTSTDDAVGTDTTTVLRASASTDAGLGSDVNTVTRLSTSTDSGVGTDITTILRISVSSDSAVGTDVNLSHGPLTLDNGVGTDEIDVRVIPFTQVIKPKPQTVYDLVVVARVPQVNGPPSYIEIDPIEWKSLDYSNTLSTTQELNATCLVSSLTEPVLQRLRDLATLATELWLYRNGVCVFAGPIQGGQTSGETLTLKAQGLLTYLRYMIVTADLKFTGTDQFNVVKTMVDQWQAQDYANFGIDTSGVGVSGINRDVTYLRNEGHNIGQRVEDLGKGATGFDIEIDPASRKLQLWSPVKGVDRSTGEDAVVIDERNITSGDIMFSVAVGDLASEAFGASTASGSDTTLYSTASNVELRSRFGRTGIFQSYSDIPDQATLDTYTQAMVDARGTALIVPGPKVRVTPDADLSAYGVGDTIAFEQGSLLGVSGGFRIRRQTITASNTGQENVDLEFV